MALTFPYPLSYTQELLEDSSSLYFDLERFEESSTNGAAQTWTAQMAPPRWFAEIELNSRCLAKARELDAKIRALSLGGTLLFADPSYLGPSYYLNPELPGLVGVDSISTNRKSVALNGLPSGYQIKIGDRLSIKEGDRYYYGEFSEEFTANASGVGAQVSVYPYIPVGFNPGASKVNLLEPTIKMMVAQGGYKAFAADASFRSGTTTLRLTQKV